MRIQPHVWASPSPGDFSSHAVDVVKNVVTTHGHPRALVGALFHANVLGRALAHGQVPTPDEWPKVADDLRAVVELVTQDHELHDLWRPEWERASGSSFESAIEAAVAEVEDLLAVVNDAVRGSDRPPYVAALETVNATDPSIRGSATVTSVLATLLAWLMCVESPQHAIDAANALGTDTDSIGTMAGAIAGCVLTAPPPGPIVDTPLIVSDAERLWNVGRRTAQKSFVYPDLLKWKVPRAQSDIVGLIDGNQIGVAGLGRAKPVWASFPSAANGLLFQWFELRFGQHILVQVREQPKRIAVELLGLGYAQPPQSGEPLKSSPSRSTQPRQAQLELERAPGVEPLEDIFGQLLQGGFHATDVGRAIMRVASHGDGVARAAALAALVAAEMKRRSRN